MESWPLSVDHRKKAVDVLGPVLWPSFLCFDGRCFKIVLAVLLFHLSLSGLNTFCIYAVLHLEFGLRDTYSSGNVGHPLSNFFGCWCVGSEGGLGPLSLVLVSIDRQGTFVAGLCFGFCCFSFLLWLIYSKSCGDSLWFYISNPLEFDCWSYGCLSFTRYFFCLRSFGSICVTCFWLEWHKRWSVSFLCRFSVLPSFADGDSSFAKMACSVDFSLRILECLPFIWGFLDFDFNCWTFLGCTWLVGLEKLFVRGIAVAAAVFRFWKGEVLLDLDQIDPIFSILVLVTKLIHSDLCFTLLSAPLCISLFSNAAACLQPVRSPSPCCSSKSLPILVDLESTVRSHTHSILGLEGRLSFRLLGLRMFFLFYFLCLVIVFRSCFFIPFFFVCNVLGFPASTGVDFFPLG